jgi:hypothetical protein
MNRRAFFSAIAAAVSGSRLERCKPALPYVGGLGQLLQLEVAHARNAEIAEFETVLKYFWDNYSLGPTLQIIT